MKKILLSIFIMVVLIRSNSIFADEIKNLTWEDILLEFGRG